MALNDHLRHHLRWLAGDCHWKLAAKRSGFAPLSVELSVRKNTTRDCSEGGHWQAPSLHEDKVFLR